MTHHPYFASSSPKETKPPKTKCPPHEGGCGTDPLPRKMLCIPLDCTLWICWFTTKMICLTEVRTPADLSNPISATQRNGVSGKLWKFPSTRSNRRLVTRSWACGFHVCCSRFSTLSTFERQAKIPSISSLTWVDLDSRQTKNEKRMRKLYASEDPTSKTHSMPIIKLWIASLPALLHYPCFPLTISFSFVEIS